MCTDCIACIFPQELEDAWLGGLHVNTLIFLFEEGPARKFLGDLMYFAEMDGREAAPPKASSKLGCQVGCSD